MTKEIIIAVMSAVVGALFSLIVSLILEKKKEKCEDSLKEKSRKQEMHQNRPELQIIKYEEYLNPAGYGFNKDCEIDVFLAHITDVEIVEGKKHRIVSARYDDDNNNREGWCCVIYTLKNAGKTNISSLYLIDNLRNDTSLFPSNNIEHCIKHGLLHHIECYDTKIHVDETVKLRICYYKTRIITSLCTASLSFVIEDDNGNYWLQPLFAPRDKLYDSKAISHMRFYEMMNDNEQRD